MSDACEVPSALRNSSSAHCHTSHCCSHRLAVASHAPGEPLRPRRVDVDDEAGVRSGGPLGDADAFDDQGIGARGRAMAPRAPSRTQSQRSKPASLASREGLEDRVPRMPPSDREARPSPRTCRRHGGSDWGIVRCGVLGIVGSRALGGSPKATDRRFASVVFRSRRPVDQDDARARRERSRRCSSDTRSVNEGWDMSSRLSSRRIGRWPRRDTRVRKPSPLRVGA